MAPPTTPEGWRDFLHGRLRTRWASMSVFDAYYNGDQALAFITRKYRDAYGGFFRGLTDNWMPLVVESSAERMRVQGFRFDNDDADGDAWEMWQANNLDGEADMVHTEAIKLGMSYWMVEPQGDGKDPQITGEHPSQVIVAVNPARRQDRLAALKRWQDIDGTIYANVYLPDRVVKYRTTRRALSLDPLSRDAKTWETVGAVANPLEVVPVVPVPNNPSMLTEGKSDLAGGPVEIQNSLNLLLSGILIGAEYQAYPLRVLLGVDTPKDPVTGEPIKNAELKVAQSRLLMFGGDAQKMDVKEFSAADLSNLRTAMSGLIRDLTAQTRTPPHYVSGEIVNASADALKAAETGLVAKTRKKMDPMGEGHEEMVRLAFRAKFGADDDRAQATDAETIWRDPETRSDAEVVDAATKLATIGVPQEALWERIGASPQEIDRWRAIQERERLLNAATTPPVQPPGTPVPPGATNGGGVPPEVAQAAAERAQAGPAAPPASTAGGPR